MPGINLFAERFALVVITQDWHPLDHKSFASNHVGAEPFSSIDMPYGAQILWPDHCVQGSKGAAFHPSIAAGALQRAHLILRKGYNPAIDSYSAFFKNDRKTRSEEHTSELQSLMRTSYAVFCLQKKTKLHNK